MKKKPSKNLRPMTPHEARNFKDICSLQSDNYSTAEGWIMIDGSEVVLCKQRSGESATASIKITRGVFKRMIDWYLRPQKRTADNG